MLWNISHTVMQKKKKNLHEISYKNITKPTELNWNSTVHMQQVN